MSSYERWIPIAVKEAQRSTYHQKVGSVIFNKSSYISSGFNNPERAIKHHLPKFRKFYNSVHAEVHAIINARKDLKGSSILVVRINKKNQFLLAKPCIYCQSYIEFVGIKKCFYSIPNYPYIEMMKIS
jgi:deoxycytidylate deaminase